MSIRALEQLFHPRSVAVIGASNTAQSVGNVVMRNLLEGGFSGPIMPVNPKYEAVAGVLAYPDVASLPKAPDLAVLCTPARTIPALVDQLGRRGTRAAVVISGGLLRPMAEGAPTYIDAALHAARRTGLRILGSNSLGTLVPKHGLNASFAHVKALPGRIAFISQSGAVCTAILDWALPRGIGFSYFISLGESSDVDFGDALDYLGRDPGTRAILLYIEHIADRRNFMAAARAAARNKPVLAIKAGIAPASRPAPDFLATGLAEPDEIFDAALRRAGVLRVYAIDELFGAVETLARTRPVHGDRIAIVSNGGGAGQMAADELAAGKLEPAQLAPETIDKLDLLLPADWSRTNPVDILANASGKRYADTLRVLTDDRSLDAVLVIHAPNALASSDEAARAVIRSVREHGGNVLTSWIGEGTVASARSAFAEAGVPTFDTPSRAVRAFLHMVNYNRNQEMLMQTPPSLLAEVRPDVEAARTVLRQAIAERGGALIETEAKSVLAAYGMRVVPTRLATTADEAARLAEDVGYPIALTVMSPDITRKWDVGGVALTLESAEAVRSAALGMAERVRQRRPDARITGFTVQRMVSRQNARQLFMGVTISPLFGPVIVFGEGGRVVEAVRDHAIGLPPLNLPLARELIGRTRVARLLEQHHDRPAADTDAVCQMLVQLSQLVVDLPELAEVDINPIFADENGVIVIDAQMRAAPWRGRESGRLAIRPYPEGLEERAALRDGTPVLVRPIRPEDEPAHQDMMNRCTPEDLRYRFFNYVGKMRHSQMARLTQIDYDREMAFVATVAAAGGATETLGVVRTITDPDNSRAEFAVMVRSDLKGKGLGEVLMRKIIGYTQARGTQEIAGEILSENKGMIRLARKLGFEVVTLPEGDLVEARYRLN